MDGSESDEMETEAPEAPDLVPGAEPKALPKTVQRRRPSLTNVLQGDSKDPKVKQALAMKLASAAADLATDTGGAPRYVQKGSEDAVIESPDGTQAIAMPLILFLTLVLFTVVTFTQRPLTEAVIDRDFEMYLEREAEHQILNEPMGAYIGCVGIIFALMYTSVYNDAQVRQSEIRNALAQEAGGVHTAMLLVRTLDADDNINKTRALLLFSSYIENLATEIFFKSRKVSENDQVLHSSIESMYAAIPFLAEIASDGEGDEMDRVLIQRVVDALNRVCEARHRRVSEERHSVSMMTFSFLTVLAIFTFYGVSFLQMGAEGLTSSVVVMTGVSLLMSMAVLADVALPWKGFIVVDTGIFISIRKDISLVLDQEQEETLMGSVGKRNSIVMSELDDEMRKRMASGVAINQHQHIAVAVAKRRGSTVASTDFEAGAAARTT